MRLASLFLLSASFLAAAPAWAVDLENRDRKEAEVTINRDDGSSETVTLKAGQKINDICSGCMILMSDTSVEVRGREVATIQGGKISAKSR